MIDALYPIMGGMISKYVTQAIKELMQSINNKIENGLSFDRYKRKAKAKMTGVSESELLLEESSDALITSMFVISKETSLLIAEAHLKDKKIDDPHIVASMASAIKDFINDWQKSSEFQNEVQILSYGNSSLYIESAGSVYVIAFLDAEPDYEQRGEINSFFASLVKEYSGFFQKFDGDDNAKEIGLISHNMHAYLEKQELNANKDNNKKNPAKYIVYLLGFLLFSYGIYLFNDWYIKHSYEKTIYRQTGEKVVIYEKDGLLQLDGHVSSIEQVNKIEKIMKRHTKTPFNNNLLVPMKHLEDYIKESHKLGSKDVVLFENKLNKLENNFAKTVNLLQDKIDTLQETLKLSQSDMNDLLESTTDKIFLLENEKSNIKKVLEVEKEIDTRLDEAFLGDAYYIKEENALDFRKLPLFTASEIVYKKDAILLLGNSFEKYMNILVEYKEYIEHINIEGHSDSSGMEEDNLALSHERALSVKDYLSGLSIVKQYKMQEYLQAAGYGSMKTIIINGEEDKNASRRIKITFELKESIMLGKLRKIIND